MKKLEQEKFDNLKVLAELQVNISTGRATLYKLKEDTEKYLVVREKEVEDRIIKVLQKSHDSLDEASKNYKELELYNIELKSYSEELSNKSIQIIDLFDDFNIRVKDSEKQTKDWEKRSTEVLDIIKNQREDIQKDRDALDKQKISIVNDMRFVTDRQGILKRGFAELKALRSKLK